MNYQKNKSKFNTGFTLVETLIAITVLMTGVVLPMSIFARSISNARSSGNQITANYLAQEAIEFVKYRVLTELNEGAGEWFDDPDIDKNCISGGGKGRCTIDSVNNVVAVCGGGCPVLLFDSTSGLYNYLSGDPSIFSRVVGLKKKPIKDGGLVFSTVSWDEGGVTRKVVVKEYMFKWR